MVITHVIGVQIRELLALLPNPISADWDLANGITRGYVGVPPLVPPYAGLET